MKQTPKKNPAHLLKSRGELSTELPRGEL